MAVSASFADVIAQGYATSGPAIELGRGVHDGELAHEALVQVPLAMMNRHGLIAAPPARARRGRCRAWPSSCRPPESRWWSPTSRATSPAWPRPARPTARPPSVPPTSGETFTPAAFPVEFLALGGIGPGVPVRATVTDFGPQLLAKVFGSNETQEQTLSLVFRYADERKLALLDLADLRAVLAFLESDEGKADLAGIGGVSPATIGVLLRALAVLEDGGGNEFFGEPQLDIADLMRTAPDGRGIDLLPRAGRRPGQAPAVLDRADVAGRRAVRAAARGGRPGQAEDGGVLRRGAPAVRRRDRRLPAVGDADGAADPLQGRRRLLRHAVADGRAGGRARPARQPHPARAARVHARRRQGAEGDHLHVPAHRSVRPRAGAAPSSPSARRWSPSCPTRACRRRWCIRGCARRSRR